MNISALQIGKHLEDATLAPLYVLCGSDASLVSGAIAALKRANESDDMPGSMAVEFDTLDDHRLVFDELYTQPFLGMLGRRMAVVRCGSELAQAAPKQLADYALSPCPTSVLVLCCEKLDRRRDPGRKLAEHSVWVDCSKVSWNEARRWLHKEAMRQGKKLESEAAYALVKAMGPDISALKREIDKLVLYTGERKVIDQLAVSEIVPAGRSRTVFELSDAIVRYEPKEAVALGEALLMYGERPEMIVAFLGARMRELWKIARLARRRMPLRDIARQVRTPEFALKRLLGAVRDRDDRWFADRLNMLAEADTELKTSSLPARLRSVWLTGIILKLCGSGRGGQSTRR